MAAKVITVHEWYGMAVPFTGTISYSTGMMRSLKHDSSHCLTGPAYTFNPSRNKSEDYYIDGKNYSKEDWEKHPQVVAYRNSTLLAAV